MFERGFREREREGRVREGEGRDERGEERDCDNNTLSTEWICIIQIPNTTLCIVRLDESCCANQKSHSPLVVFRTRFSKTFIESENTFSDYFQIQLMYLRPLSRIQLMDCGISYIIHTCKHAHLESCESYHRGSKTGCHKQPGSNGNLWCQ